MEWVYDSGLRMIAVIPFFFSFDFFLFFSFGKFLRKYKRK